MPREHLFSCGSQFVLSTESWKLYNGENSKIKLKHYVSGLSLFSIAANSKYSKSF